MAIIIGGKPVVIDDLKKKVEVVQPIQEVVPPPPVEVILPPVEPTFVPPTRIIQTRKAPQITDSNTLIVNGRRRTIGRKSQYLLDMMIIDDE
jgi:hypothetical protein